jgi:hypothetical protein
VIYPIVRTGRIEICIDQAGETRGTWHQCTYAVHVAFDDSARDPGVEIRAELIAREPGVDPDLVL